MSETIIPEAGSTFLPLHNAATLILSVDWGLGAAKAITATAHKLARTIYSMLRYGQDYVDAGAEHYESQYQQRGLLAAKRRAAQLGYQLVHIPDGDHQDPSLPLNPVVVA